MCPALHFCLCMRDSTDGRTAVRWAQDLHMRSRDLRTEPYRRERREPPGSSRLCPSRSPPGWAGLAPDAPRWRVAVRPPACAGRRADPGVRAVPPQTIEQVLGISDDSARSPRRAPIARSNLRRRALAQRNRGRTDSGAWPGARALRDDHRSELDNRAEKRPVRHSLAGHRGRGGPSPCRAEPVPASGWRAQSWDAGRGCRLGFGRRGRIAQQHLGPVVGWDIRLLDVASAESVGRCA